MLKSDGNLSISIRALHGEGGREGERREGRREREGREGGREKGGREGEMQ